MQSELIKNDFNEIALLDDKNKWNHNNCYYKSLIKLIPENAVNCLEIGCGKGDLSVLLSKKCRNVIAVDFAENMMQKTAIQGKISVISVLIFLTLIFPI